MKAKTWAGAVVLAALIGVALLTTGDSPEALDAPRSSKWPAVRAAHLEKHPTCAACGGDEQLNVHHILPFSVRPDLEMEADNLITLCTKRGCHFLIGHAASWHGYNEHVREDATRILSRVEANKRRAKP